MPRNDLLAVNGHRLTLTQAALLQPPPKLTLKGLPIQPAERRHLVQRGHARCPLPGEPQSLGYLLPLVSTPLADGVQTARPAQHGTHRQSLISPPKDDAFRGRCADPVPGPTPRSTTNSLLILPLTPWITPSTVNDPTLHATDHSPKIPSVLVSSIIERPCDSDGAVDKA